MSSLTAPARRPNLLARLFNWLVGDAAVDGVDPALHRRALWVAFIITGAVYIAYFILLLPLSFDLPEPVYEFLFGYDKPNYGLIWWLPNVNSANLWQVLLAPMLVYALVLKTRGVKFPLAVLDIATCVLVGYIFDSTVRLKYFGTPVALLLVFALMFLRGRLKRRMAIWVAGISLGLWFLLEILRFSTMHLMQGAMTLSQPFERWMDLLLVEGQVFSVVWLPFSIALPIVLLAQPRTPQLRPLAKNAWQLTTVLVLSVLVAATSSALYYIGRSNLIPSGLIWMATLTLLVTLLWLYYTGQATGELLAFFALAVAGIVVINSLIPWVAMPDWLRAGLSLAVGCLLALVLATNAPMRRTNLWAALTVVVGSFAATIWDALIISRYAERSRNLLWQVDPGWFVQLELSLLVELALFIGALLLAWWFVKPAEVEALLPWLAKLKSNRKASLE